jgi:uncharacterized protein (DUF1778 family)
MVTSRPTTSSFTAERKTDRLELRVTPSAKEVIQRACAVSGLSPGDIAYEGARRILQDHGGMRLSDADAKVFYEALASPPEPAPRLIEALQQHGEQTKRE